MNYHKNDRIAVFIIYLKNEMIAIMKIMKSILLSLAMSVLFINTAMANNYNPDLKVEGNKFYVTLENASAQTSVRILDGQGYIWLEERVTVPGKFKKVFNLSKLPVGSYTLIIKSNLKETIQPIRVTSKELIVDESKQTVYYQANFEQKRGKVNISLLNPTNSLIRIFVINPQGRILYQDLIKNQEVIDTNYNLRGLPRGNYTLFVDNAHETFSKNIRL